jgi:hypothetical protein
MNDVHWLPRARRRKDGRSGQMAGQTSQRPSLLCVAVKQELNGIAT